MARQLNPEYLALLRRMTGAQKLRAVARLYHTARVLKEARLRELHPDWPEEQVR